jgi:hypothetical protein
MAKPDVAQARAVQIARWSRLFGIPMHEVRRLTLRDLSALLSVIKEERAQAERQRQATKARGPRRR